MKAKLFTDGGSRGNPGPAAYAFVLEAEDGTVLDARGEAIGVATNNVAEYSALVAGLEPDPAANRTQRVSTVCRPCVDRVQLHAASPSASSTVANRGEWRKWPRRACLFVYPERSSASLTRLSASSLCSRRTAV